MGSDAIGQTVMDRANLEINRKRHRGITDAFD
jgi:hypothetical protein